MELKSAHKHKAHSTISNQFSTCGENIVHISHVNVYCATKLKKYTVNASEHLEHFNWDNEFVGDLKTTSCMQISEFIRIRSQ